MALNLTELLLGEAQRLSFVDRFSTTKVLRKENVAEHTFYVTFYSMVIIEWLDAKGFQFQPCDRYDTMVRALMHDVEECRSGDFPRPFKYSNQALKELLDKASIEATRQTIGSFLGRANWTSVDQLIFDRLFNLWQKSKDESYSGRIVKFADFLSVLAYVCDEVRSGNKKTLLRHMETMEEYCHSFDHDDYNFLRPLVLEAQGIMLGEFANG